MTKIEYVLDVDDFMQHSEQVAKKIQTGKEKKGKELTSKECWRVINNQIKRKVANSKSAKGVCNCDGNMMCEHRKKYLKVVLDGRPY